MIAPSGNTYYLIMKKLGVAGDYRATLDMLVVDDCVGEDGEMMG